jgi:hypothetical protein
MTITKKEVDGSRLSINHNGVVILPNNYSSNDDPEYSSTVVSFYKYSKEKLQMEYLSEPTILIEQRSGDWFGPVLLICTSAILNNPALIAITCGVISNYVTDFFKGKSEPNIRCKVIVKETKTSKTTEISYEGGIEGLKSLEGAIQDSVKKGVNNE